MSGASMVGFKQRWLAEHLIGAENAMLVGNALSFIGEAKQVGPVSAHPYNQSAVKLLEAVEAAGGMALDCGAGRRDFTADHLVQIDVMPYPNVDVLCDAQALPFVDASFDLVMSFAVLEHVANPFEAAAEIMRVLKPGGIIYVDAPMVVTEHGYPSHFFNMTRSGLRKLFEGMDCRAHAVPNSGHPTQALHTVLSTFRAGLPKSERAAFDQMTVAEIVALSHKELQRKMCQNFHPDVKWKLAATTCAIFHKPGADLLDFTVDALPQFGA
jgi:SAM-dependent methyltransferase